MDPHPKRKKGIFMSSGNVAMGVGIGIGALVVGAGAAFAAMSYFRDHNKKEESSKVETSLNVDIIDRRSPDRIIGRPFSNPFFANYGRSSMWGSGPWAHRAPSVRPVTPRFFDHHRR